MPSTGVCGWLHACGPRWHRRGRAGRAAAVPPAGRARHRLGRASRTAAADYVRGADPGRRARGRARWSCCATAGPRRPAATARAWSTAASTCSSRASGHHSTSATLTGGRSGHRLRPDRGRQGPHRPRGCAGGPPLEFEVSDTALHGSTPTGRPSLHRRRRDRGRSSCDVIAGCDGFHGICRAAIPPGVLTVRDRDYPYAWLGHPGRGRRPPPTS